MKLKSSLKVSDIAAKFNATIIGDQSLEVGSINEIHKLTEDSITFVDHIKYYKKVINSIASVIIINQKAECPEGKALLVVDNPFEVYNQLAKDSRPFEKSNKLISEKAIIGEGTHLQPNVFVGNNVTIGKNCIIHPNVTIYDNTIIGDNVIIHANSTIGSDAFYYNKQNGKFIKMHSVGRAIIEDDVEIGSSVSIDCGVSGDTVIGSGSKLDSQVHIGHGTIIGKNCLFAAQVAVAGKCSIGNDVILYGKVGVSKDIVIGDEAVMLASSNTDKDLEGGKVYYGSPAILARDKWKEMVCTRKLPEIWDRIQLKQEKKGASEAQNFEDLIA